MEKNGIYEGVVSGLGTDGEGIIRIEGTTVFVPFCLVGEKVKFKVLKIKGNIAYGKVESIETSSYSRVNPPCPVFKKCGGCALQHMDYGAQLDFKRNTIENALKKIGGVFAEVGECVPCSEQYRYRNKLALPIGVINGETVCGFYSLRSHRIVPLEDCLIQSEWVKEVVSEVLRFSKTCGICGYDEEQRTGVLRRIVVREIKGKFIFALVTAENIDVKPLIRGLEKSFKDFTFLLNINNSAGNALFSDKWRVCRGSGCFEAEEHGIKYSAGANTFLQVNDDVREKLYSRVLAEAEDGVAALDLYSGGGMLTAMLAKKCGLAYGIEAVKEASECADELKMNNSLDGKMFNICGKVEDKLAEVFKKTQGKRRLIVCDPPRKGMERSVVEAIRQSGADKVVLVSCNPATLARDLGLLLGTLRDGGSGLVKTDAEPSPYKICEIIPFDMFPQTKWVETLVVLSRI